MKLAKNQLVIAMATINPSLSIANCDAVCQLQVQNKIAPGKMAKR